jgi:methyl-accepting chemotaxis protein
MAINADTGVARNKWTLSNKLLLLMTVSGALPFLIFSYLSLITLKEGIINLNQNRLVSIRETKKLQIEDYFKQIKKQIITYSSNRMIIDAMKEFKVAFFAIEEGSKKLDPSEENKLFERYEYQVEHTFGVSPDVISRWMPKNTTTKLLQSLYISENSYPIGEKEKLDAASDPSTYSQLHQKYHPVIRQFLQAFGYYDIFLVDPDTGYILYSVFKEVDYATSLKTGPYSNTGISRAYKGALNLNNRDSFYIDDFKHYEPEVVPFSWTSFSES